VGASRWLNLEFSLLFTIGNKFDKVSDEISRALTVETIEMLVFLCFAIS
jgi:hypothetical protein